MTRAHDAAVQADEKSAEIRRSHGQLHKQFASRPFGSTRNEPSSAAGISLRGPSVQGPTYRCADRMAPALRGLIDAGLGRIPRLSGFV